MRLLEKRKYFISTEIVDSMTLMVIRSKMRGLQFRGSVFPPFLWNAVMLVDFQADERFHGANDRMKRAE